jgi:hypothetical protein
MILVKYLTDYYLTVYSHSHSSIITFHNDHLVNVPQSELVLPVNLEK